MKSFSYYILFIILFLFFAAHAFGASCGPDAMGTSYTLCEKIPGIDPVQTDFAGFFAQLYRLALILGGTVIFIQIVRGGIMYTISGVVNYQQKAKEIFMNAAWGGALLIGSYLILKTINPALVLITVPSIAQYAPEMPPTASSQTPHTTTNNASVRQARIEQNQVFLDATREQILNLEATMASGRGGPAAQTRLDALYKNYANKQAEITRLQSSP